ncbi:hypothetical protein HXX76_009252 [Chlamydomonas incerta]|uniref:HORMA domain-containing protein n=1 Tax=Chlamydomonas incerta TaxID=51695 RepID=A0A835W0L5_CHLIN|nr:hypothetical protein HXX76_009252 [Chlamydomonas incerta]|eukprot:KAG2431756.1 hypothetical protein HXX76_009252 [Chlamydomonas incerta]
MGRPKVAAQAQAQAQVAISHTESLELVRCLLRVSIFHVAYLRGLFPEKSFKGVDMKNLDDMHIKMLLPTCDESRRLVDWVEGGVYDSIKRGYLKNLFFGISTDPEGTQLLEEYIFTFRYGEGRVAMDVNATANGSTEGGGEAGGLGGGKRKGQFKQKDGSGGDGAGTDLNTVRYQVCRLIRMLVQVCRTLDKVPAERYLFMKLTYQDHTPDEYEPPYFVPVDESGVGHFHRSPFSMAVGRVNTDHHAVSLKVKSTLDSCDDDLNLGDAEDELMAGAAAGADAAGDAAGERQHQHLHGRAPPPSAGSVGSGDAGTGTGTEAGAGATDDVTAGGGDEGGDGAADGEGEGEDGEGLPPASQVTQQTQEQRREEDEEEEGAGVGEGMDGDVVQLREQEVEEGGAQAAAAAPGNGAGGGDGMDIDGEAATAAAAAAGGEGDDVTEVPEEATDDYRAVVHYCAGRSQVSMRQLGRHFASHMSQGALGGYVSRLAEQGVLVAVPGAKTTWRVNAAMAVTATAAATQVMAAPARPADAKAAGGVDSAAPPPPAADADPAAMLVERMDGLTMGPAAAATAAAVPAAAPPPVQATAAAGGRGGRRRGAPPAGAAVPEVAKAAREDAADVRRPSRDQLMEAAEEEEARAAEGRDRDLKSRGGRMESGDAGDAVTGGGDSGAGKSTGRGGGGAGTDGDGGDATAAANVYIADSQQSDRDREKTRGGRVRKASYVADPIQQGAGAAAPDGAAAPGGGGGGSKKARTAAAAAAPAPTPAPKAKAGRGEAKGAGAGSTPRGRSRLGAMRR